MKHETLQSKCVSLELDLKIAKSALVAISKMPGCGVGKARREAQQTLNMLSEAGKLSSALLEEYNRYCDAEIARLHDAASKKVIQ